MLYCQIAKIIFCRGFIFVLWRGHAELPFGVQCVRTKCFRNKRNWTEWDGRCGGTSFLPQPWRTVITPLQRKGQSGLGPRWDLPPWGGPGLPHGAWGSCVMVWTLGCSPPILPLASASSEFGISVIDAGDVGSFPGSRRFPGGGNDSLLQYSRLGNPTDRGVRWATDGSVICVYSCAPSIVSSLLTGRFFTTSTTWEAPGFPAPWVGKIPWRRKSQPTAVFFPGKFHGQRRSLVGYSPWGHKESDMTERLHFHFITIEKVNRCILTEEKLGRKHIVTKFVSKHFDSHKKEMLNYMPLFQRASKMFLAFPSDGNCSPYQKWGEVKQVRLKISCKERL